MPVNRVRMREALKRFDFDSLMIEELGWDRHRMAPLEVITDGKHHVLQAIAEKRGMVVFLCGPGDSGDIPSYPTRRKIEAQVRRSAHEHVIVFVDRAQTLQVWQWVRREPGRPAACREHQFHKDQRGDALAQKLESISFGLDEEENLTIATVAGRARQAFDVDRITKKFYERFTNEHSAFLDFIQGIHAQGDREWYASLMLNRLMFTYFIQKKGFLDGDHDYLRNRMKAMQERKGKDKFLSFYRHFLLRLFHEGLGSQKHSSELDELLGKVPYLNGGLFDVHLLERENPGVEIGDDAFERVFDFFDAYQWHLDERPLRADNEINPDVLGYIFEKYINQRQMGAYYTKEDITEYIGKSSLIPYLCDEAEKKCAIAFKADAATWRLLRDDPDRYIYKAVRSDERLPTETNRQLDERRIRSETLRATLASGSVQTVNELVSMNLDVRQFAQDAIEMSEGPELLRAFYRGIRNLSVLDPTCGSGAFLFAALNVLEPLYEASLDRMQSFLNDAARLDGKGSAEKFADFRKILSHVNEHPNRRYFILKSIIINNLFGVDIMEEAVEICKLRLFLKLVAQVDRVEDIEPLPDIDFNIRPGNTLVGFVNYDDVKKTVLGDLQAKMDLAGNMDRIDEEAEIADRAFSKFREMQTEYGMDAEAFADAKLELRRRLDGLAHELDRYLASEYGIQSFGVKEDLAPFSKWRAAHQPFHWFVEFYGIMKRGGFDVVIGNPLTFPPARLTT